MPRAVTFDRYGGPEVLQVVEVERPEPGAGQLLVRVKAAGINPGEISIREGRYADRWPATFPSGQGSDFAGVVERVGPGVDAFAVGDEVLGWTNRRAAQAEYVVAEADEVLAKPGKLAWEVAGALHVVGATAFAALEASEAGESDTLVVAGAAGGVGLLAAQMAIRIGGMVIGLASESNHAWLRSHYIDPVDYHGERLAERILAATRHGRVDAFIDTFGAGYVALAVDELGVSPDRVDTIIDFAAAERYGVKTDGNAVGQRVDVLAEQAMLLAAGELELPIARTYPLEQVREAYEELANRHTRGKIVLIP